MNSEQVGDLIYNVVIPTPTELTERQQELLSELAESMADSFID